MSIFLKGNSIKNIRLLTNRKTYRQKKKQTMDGKLSFHSYWKSFRSDFIIKSTKITSWLKLLSIYRVWQNFCDIVYFAYMSTWENDKILIFLLKDTVWKGLQKQSIRKSLLTGSNNFFVVIIDNLYATAISQCNQTNRNVSKTFSFFSANLCTQLV